MGDLLNFDDDGEENLFKPPENKLDKSFDDIFGDIDNDPTSPGSLDDILKPDVSDDIFNTPASKKVIRKRSLKKTGSMKRTVDKKKVDSMFGDVDEEPDLFGAPSSTKSSSHKSVLDEDFFDQMVPQKTAKSTGDELDDFFGNTSSDKPATSTSADLDDLFGPPSNTSESADKKTTLQDMHDKTKDSLDLLLDAQPLETVSSSEDLLSLVESETNVTVTSNFHNKHVDNVQVGTCSIFASRI